MSFWDFGSSAGMWLAPVTALAVMAGLAAIVLLRDHLRLERHALALEAEVDRLTAEYGRIAERDESHRSILSAQRELIVARDADGFITYANDAFARFAQRRRAALLGSKSLPRATIARAPQALAEGGLLVDEAYEGPDGESWVSWIETPLPFGEGTGTLRVGREIQPFDRLPAADGSEDAARRHRIRETACAMVGLASLLQDGAGNDGEVLRLLRKGGDDLLALLEERPASSHPQAADAGERPAGPPRALLAEDNEINALLALQTLQRAGVVVDWVKDGHEAFESVRASFEGAGPAYDLVLMDLRMPGVDGFEAARRIRSLEGAMRRADPLRIVALTATAMRQDRLAAQAAGIDDFLSKPYRAEALAGLLVPPERLLKVS
jgi:CheY-like chemotaxis protein